MEFTFNLNDLVNRFSKSVDNLDEEVIKIGIARLSEEMVDDAKYTVENFTNRRGRKVGFDTGLFYNSIHAVPTHGGYGFKIVDGVEYGIYHEFGTRAHWVPFFDRNGNLTDFGDWALRHFSELGFTVVSKSTGKNLKRVKPDDKIQALRNRGGMTVKLDEMMPFRKAIMFGEREYLRIFKEAYDAFTENNP